VYLKLRTLTGQVGFILPTPKAASKTESKVPPKILPKPNKNLKITEKSNTKTTKVPEKRELETAIRKIRNAGAIKHPFDYRPTPNLSHFKQVEDRVEVQRAEDLLNFHPGLFGSLIRTVTKRKYYTSGLARSGLYYKRSYHHPYGGNLEEVEMFEGVNCSPLFLRTPVVGVYKIRPSILKSHGYNERGEHVGVPQIDSDYEW
jgi:hypothetical protein